MADPIVEESWEGRNDAEADGKRDIKRELTVFCTPPGSGDVLNTIKNATGVPKVGNIHPRISGYYCYRRETASGNGPNSFKVIATYSPRRVPDITDPLSADPQISWEKYTAQEAIDTDLDDAPIASSAGEPYDPPFQHERSCPLLVFTKNFDASVVTPSWLDSWSDKVNDDDFTLGGDTVGIGEALILEQPTAQLVEANDSAPAYYRVTFRIAFRLGQGEDAWQLRALDQGYRALNDDGDLYTICGDDGQPLNKPSLLDGTGKLLDGGDPPVFVTFRIRDSADFDGIGLVLP